MDQEYEYITKVDKVYPQHIFSHADLLETENFDPCLALREALDHHGIFNMFDMEHLEFEDFCHMKAICYRQVLRTMEPKR